MSFSVMAALGLLVLVAALPMPRHGRPILGVVVLLAAIVGGAWLVRLVIARTPQVANTRASAVLKYASHRLGEASERNVLLLDGGSYVERGVDATQLERELDALGYSVRAVRMAMIGANHFERYRMYEELVSRWPSAKLAQQRWVFMLEVQSDYDHDPLAQFRKNQDTARAYYALTPSNAFYALAAHYSGTKAIPLTPSMHFAVARHGLINGFNVGMVDRLISLEELRPETGAIRNQRPRRFEFEGTRKLRKALRSPPPEEVVPAWLKQRDRRLRRLMRNRIDQWVYFGLPSTDLAQLQYLRTFCGKQKDICLEPGDSELLKDLDKKRLWLDAGHLNRQGSRVYTRWLAQRLADSGALVK